MQNYTQDVTPETETQETVTQDTVARDGEASTTVETQTVTQKNRMSTIVIMQRIVWLLIGFINVIIALRFILLLLGANKGAGFTDFIYSISAPFVAPFVGIFPEPVYGESIFEVSCILAIVVYLLVGLGISKLLTVTRPHEEI